MAREVNDKRAGPGQAADSEGGVVGIAASDPPDPAASADPAANSDAAGSPNPPGHTGHTATTRPAWGPDAATAAATAGTVAVVWLAAKVLSIWAWVVLPGQYGDTYYYFLTAEAAATGGGVAEALSEYPTPAGLLLLLPYEWGATHWDSYRAAILWMTSLADAAFALLLGRRVGPLAVLAWVLLTSSLGQLALLRFDMLPAVVAGAAVLLAVRGGRVGASVLVALGTGLKLWPIVLLPLTLGVRRRERTPRRARLTASIAFGATGVLLVVISLVAGGWDRLLSPLDYQRDRGLQIEAVAATVPMTRWAEDEAYRVWFSTFHAFEVTGPSVAQWLQVAQAASVVGALGCVALLAWWLLRGGRPEAVPWLALVLVGTFVVTSRALSPQYLLWLAAPAAVLIGLALAGGAGTPPLVPSLVTFTAVVVLCLLTTGVYPVHYGGVTGRGASTDEALALLTVRNLGLVALVLWSAACALVTAGSRDVRAGLPARGSGRR